MLEKSSTYHFGPFRFDSLGSRFSYRLINFLQYGRRSRFEPAVLARGTSALSFSIGRGGVFIPFFCQVILSD